MLSNIMSPLNISKKYNNPKILYSKKRSINKFNKKNLLFYNRSSEDHIRNKRQYKPINIIENIEDEKNQKNYSSIFNRQNSNQKISTLLSNYNNLRQNTKTKNTTTYRNNSSSFVYSKSCSSYIISNDLLNRSSNNYITDIINSEQKNFNNIDKKSLQMKRNDDEIENMIKFLNLHNYSHLSSNNSNKISKIPFKFSQTMDNKIKIRPYKKTSETKFNIEGTNIISPFCSYARDNFLYKKIFYYSERKNLKSDFYLDNKLNIIYAEDQEKYKQTLIKLNQHFKKIGKKMFYDIEPPLSEIRLRFIKDKMDFIKKIVDYAYPNMVLTKIRYHDKNKTHYHNILKSDIITCKINQSIRNSNSRTFGEHLGKSFSVKRFHFRKYNCNSQI